MQRSTSIKSLVVHIYKNVLKNYLMCTVHLQKNYQYKENINIVHISITCDTTTRLRVRLLCTIIQPFNYSDPNIVEVQIFEKSKLRTARTIS